MEEVGWIWNVEIAGSREPRTHRRRDLRMRQEPPRPDQTNTLLYSPEATLMTVGE